MLRGVICGLCERTTGAVHVEIVLCGRGARLKFNGSSWAVVNGAWWPRPAEPREVTVEELIAYLCERGADI